MQTPSCQALRVLERTAFGQSGDEARFQTLRLGLPSGEAGEAWKSWRPGQFVMLRPERFGKELTWGRPFSICRLDVTGLTVFFQVLGRGTNAMADLAPGETVLAWGPLGQGFAVEPERNTLLLAGGMGIAPFVGYALAHPKPENLTLVFGHRMPLSCYPYALLAGKIAAEHFPDACAEDLACFVKALGERIAALAPDKANGLVLSCGPLPFLRAVQGLALAAKTRTQLSMEERMACGVGACLGCVTENAHGDLVRVCAQGPVFWAEDLRLPGASPSGALPAACCTQGAPA